MSEYECTYEIKAIETTKDDDDDSPKVTFTVKTQFIQFNIMFYIGLGHERILNHFTRELTTYSEKQFFCFPTSQTMLSNKNNKWILSTDCHRGGPDAPCTYELHLIGPERFILMIQQFCDELESLK